MRIGRDHTCFPRQGALLVILAVCLTPPLCFSQEIRNVDFEVVDSSVRITYDITGCSGEKKYDLKLLLGTDTELTEISRGLSGDVRDVTCGPSKMILWDVLSDRDELKGRIYFAVVIHQVREEIILVPPDKFEEPDERIDQPGTKVDEPEERVEEEQIIFPESGPIENEKRWERPSWKADKGFVGGSLGMFTPNQNHSVSPYGPGQNGFFLNASFGYLPSLLMGVSTTIFFFGAPQMNNLRISSWMSCGIMAGPLISLPIGNKIKWETKAQIGYARIYPVSDQSDPNLDSKWSGLATNFGTGLRLNFGKRTCYMLNVEYLSATRDFDDHQIETDLKLLGASFGIAFRLLK